MGIIIDLVLVSILLINIVIGYKKGLINVIVSILAFFVAIIATFILYKPISVVVMKNTTIDDTIKNAIVKNNEEASSEDGKKNMSVIEEYIASKIGEKAIETKDEAVELVADTVSIKAVEIITAVGLFIIVRILAILLKFLTGAISEIPIIEQFNQVGGVIYGILKSIVIIYIILLVLFFAVSINGKGMLQNAIDSSYITKFLFENNVVKLLPFE